MESEPIQVQATLALCMIARNEATDLRRALSSIKDVVQEIIVVDTGSTDETREVALEFGAQVIDFNPTSNPEAFLWDDETQSWFLADFASARNTGFDRATCDYIIWMDADDVIVNIEGVAVSLAMAKQYDCESVWVALDYDAEHRLWRDRIVKRGHKRWVGKVHEVLVPADTGCKARTDFFHLRQCAREGTSTVRVRNRNYRILRNMIEHDPKELENHRTLFYLARESQAVSIQESLAFFALYLEKATWVQERAMAWMDVGAIHERLLDWEAAARVYEEAVKEPGKFPEAWFGRARCAYHQQDWPACIEYCEKGFELGNESILLIDRELARTHDPYHWYSVALWMSGKGNEAIQSCQQGLIIKEHPLLKADLEFYTAELSEAGLLKPIPKKWAVCIVRPEGYHYSDTFNEIAESLKHGLSELGYDVSITSNPYRTDVRSIVLGAHLLPANAKPLPSDAIIYNFEQLGNGMRWDAAHVERMRSHETWEYSPLNQTWLKEQGIDAKLVPVGSYPIVFTQAVEDIDVFFVGSLNERRQKIIDELRARGLRVEVASGFGPEREDLMARAKICLNVHHYDTKIFEIVRVSHWFNHRKFVVSETSVNAESYQDMAVFADYDQLVDVCCQYVDDPWVRRGIASRGYTKFIEKHKITDILRAVLGEACETNI